MTRAILAVSVLIAAATGAFMLLKPDVNRLPTMPDLLRRPSEATASIEWTKANATVAKYRAKIQEHPENLENYALLAETYLQESRATANHHTYVPIAEGVVDAALARNPNYFEAMVTKANIDMTKHRFADAKTLISRAIAINSSNSGAFGVLCDANVELGLYDEAVKANERMMHARPDLRSYARASYLREIYGDTPGAIEAMKLAADAGEFGAENREWALYHLGLTFLHMGKLETARFLFKGILEERPDYGFALSGLAAIDAAQHNYPAAIEQLVRAIQIMPEHMFVEQLSDVYKAMGDSATTKQMEAKVIDAFTKHEEAGWNVDRELAAYLLEHDLAPQDALSRAKKEFERRSDNIDVLDTYAWALYKNGRAGDAQPIIDRALRMKTRSGMLHYHAGLIYAACHDRARAATELTTAMTIDPELTLLSKPIALKALQQSTGIATN